MRISTPFAFISWGYHRRVLIENSGRGSTDLGADGLKGNGDTDLLIAENLSVQVASLVDLG